MQAKYIHQVEGNLAKDPIVRYNDDGTVKVCNIRVIYNTRRLVNGEWKDGTPLTYDVACWDRLAAHVAKHSAKGDPVIVDLRPEVKTRTYEGNVYLSYTAENVSVPMRSHPAASMRANKPATGDTVQTPHGEVFPIEEMAAPVPVPA